MELALEELGASEQEVSVEIVQDPRAGFLGVGGHGATVRVRLKQTASPASPAAEEDLDEQGDIAAEFLEGVLGRMGIGAEVEPGFDEGTMYVDISSPSGDVEPNAEEADEDDLALLIGRHGQTLEALQELARTVVAHRTGMRPRIVVDVAGYRRRQRGRLEARAREVARRVARNGREEMLDPMNAFERKIVHDAVASVRGAETTSRGEEPERRVVIRPSG